MTSTSAFANKGRGRGDHKDDDVISEDEKQRILRVIEQEEDSSDEQDSSDEDNEDSQAEQNSRGIAKEADEDDSFCCSDNDIMNRSLESASLSELNNQVHDPENFLRYVSDKFNANLDVLQIVDKNERSFKQVAEKMI